MTDKTQNPQLAEVDETAGNGAPLLAEQPDREPTAPSDKPVCACEGYTIRTDYGTGVEHDVDRSSCPIHSPPDDTVDRPALAAEQLAETCAALRTEIGPPTDRDRNWQPMVSAGELRILLDAITALTAEREAHASEVERLRGGIIEYRHERGCDWVTNFSHCNCGMDEAWIKAAETEAVKAADGLLARAEQAERQVRAGLALADEWEVTDRTGLPPSPNVFRNHAADLRAALSGVSGPTTEAACPSNTVCRGTCDKHTPLCRHLRRPTTEGASDE